MRLFIRDGSIQAADLQGRVLLSIPGNSILDFADTKSFRTLGDNIRLGDDDWNGCAEGCAGVALYAPILIALDQVSHTGARIRDCVDGKQNYPSGFPASV